VNAAAARLERLAVHDFRNLAHVELEAPADGFVLIGENGQGKTNLLEAIHYFHLLRSSRGARDLDVVRFGENAFQVIQDSFDDFTIRVVPGDGYSERTREIVRTRFREGYGRNARVSFVEVPGIARRPSGKMQVIVGLPQATPASNRDRTNVDECID